MATALTLGERQIACLRTLIRHGSWPSGWIWENDSTTVRILDSLVRRGLVAHTAEPGRRYGVYRPTDAGRRE